MPTMYRRRQYRDRRARQVTLEELAQTDFYIGLHIGITGFFFALLVMVVLLGDKFLNLFVGG